VRKITVFIFPVLVCLLFSCAQKIEEKPEFLEFRLHRWTSLEGGETIIIRRVGHEWKGFLRGDGERFSCFYSREVKPRSDWNQVWNTLLANDVRNISSQRRNYGIEDGEGFVGEFTMNEELTRFSIPHPYFQDPAAVKNLLSISDYLSQEFGTPVFVAKYDRGKVGEYLINNCKDIKE
jgi:hypothetical protein